jgi:CBS domain-containing protein
MQIKDVMSRDVEIVAPDTPVRDAACRMRDLDTGFLPVGENDRLVGMITDRDIAVRAVAEGKDIKSTCVRDAMTDDVIYCFEDQETDDAAKLMSDRQIRRLPILNRQKRLVGVVSVGDLARVAGARIASQAMQGIAQPTHHEPGRA